MAVLLLTGVGFYQILFTPSMRPLGLLLLAVAALAGGLSLVHRRVERQRALALRDLATLSPRELELHVAQLLGALPGWSAQATRSAGDQGADVIA